MRTLLRYSRRLPAWLVTLVVSTYLLVAFNGAFFVEVADVRGIADWRDIVFLASTALLLWALIYFFLSLLTFPYLTKPILSILLLLSSVAAYGMRSYNIIIDKTMMQNVMETDWREAAELVSSDFILFFLVTGVLPVVLLWRSDIYFGSAWRLVAEKALIAASCFVVVTGIIFSSYQDFVPIFREHRYIRDLIVPMNFLRGMRGYLDGWSLDENISLEPIGLDSQRGAAWAQPSPKRLVAVLIVGETARAQNFSLYGYSRETNPALASIDVVPFLNVSSCGTTTAVSLPCMFSMRNRTDFDSKEARRTENLLDVVQRAGVEVVWIDNTSGCKGICDRVGERRPDSGTDPINCTELECYDNALLSVLEKQIASTSRDVLIVLHQSGSHGPAYYQRVPPAFQRFKPYCKTVMLQECSRAEVLNAYDNTILYTDQFIAGVIQTVERARVSHDGVVLYVSDHGESLGENNLYLHGLPYFFAPSEQTHVPMIAWLSEGYLDRFAMDKECLTAKRAERFSHDNLFHSVLGILALDTTVYKNELDIFYSCSRPEAQTFVSKMAE